MAMTWGPKDARDDPGRGPNPESGEQPGTEAAKSAKARRKSPEDRQVSGKGFRASERV